MTGRAGLGRHSACRGSSTLEMTMVGIPLIFTLISIFEISRGMWIYHTLAYTVNEAVRYAAVHGKNCVLNPPTVTNDCTIQVSAIATKIRNNGSGALLCNDGTYSCVTLTLTPAGGCSTLAACLTTNTVWPPSGSNDVGMPLQIDIRIPFNSALGMLFPGTGYVAFAPVNLGASTNQQIQF